MLSTLRLKDLHLAADNIAVPMHDEINHCTWRRQLLCWYNATNTNTQLQDTSSGAACTHKADVLYDTKHVPRWAIPVLPESSCSVAVP